MHVSAGSGYIFTHYNQVILTGYIDQTVVGRHRVTR